MATGFSNEVFLGFRGEPREKILDHIYGALEQANIHTFQNDGRKRGKWLKSDLKKAVHESAISLIVFSKNYASSEWRLDEALTSMEEHETLSSKHEVLPVFYKVEPSDVRYQTGTFQETFDAYDEKIKAETNIEKKRELSLKVGAWKASLTKATFLTGLVYKDGYAFFLLYSIENKSHENEIHLYENNLSTDPRIHAFRFIPPPDWIH